MPELPEVETVKRGLQKMLIGKVIAKVSFDWPKSFPNAEADVKQFLIGSRIESVSRRAKVLIIKLNTQHTLIVHLKMTGQLVFVSSTNRWGAGHPNDSLIGKLPDKSTRVIFTFTDNSYLYFNDQRKFGWVRLLPAVEVSNIDFFKNVGPEPLSDDFTIKEFVQRLQKRANSTIKATLLNQTVIAGIGNIYADEALFLSKIHPALRVKDVSDSKLKTLFYSIRDVLQLGINKGGSSDKNYINAEGKKGSYLDFASVFRREGKPCLRCGYIIKKIRVAGRGTHICPHEQKLPKGYK